MLAIARPNPYKPTKKGSTMLRRISSSGSRSSRRNPSTKRKTLSQVLKQARSKSRSNGMSLRDRVRKSQSLRKNHAIDSKITDRVNTLIADVKAQRLKARKSPTFRNKEELKELQAMLKEAKSELDMAASSLRSVSRAKKASTKRRKTSASSKRRKSSSSRKRSTSSRKNPAMSLDKAAKSSKLYKKLRTSAQKAKFVRLFKQVHKKMKRGASVAQANARAALSAYSKVKSGSTSSSRKTSSRKTTRKTKRKVTRRTRRNPISAASSLSNPARKKRKSVSKKRKTTTRRKSSARKPSSASDIRRLAMKSSFYKKLRGTKRTAFVRHFVKLFKTYNRKRGVTELQAAARAGLAAYSKVKSSTSSRKNPARKKSTRRASSSRRRTTSRRKSSSTRKRAKRMKSGMRASAKRVLSKYGPYTYRITVNGKVITLKASKTSSAYRSGKRNGLKGAYRKLSAKKNTPTSLNLRSVYKIVDGRPTRKDFQKAIDTWAGALDGGKIRGVSKRDIQRSRVNPKALRQHTIRAISNPAPMGIMSMYRDNQSENMYMNVGIGALAGIASAYLSSMAAGGLASALEVTSQAKKEKSVSYLASEGIFPLATTALAVYAHQRDVDNQTKAIAFGAAAGSIYSLLARTVMHGLARLPGFKAITRQTDEMTFGIDENSDPTLKEKANGYLVDNQHNMRGLSDMSASRVYGMHQNPSRIYGNHVGRFVTEASSMGRYVSTPSSMGRYVSTSNSRSNPVARRAVPSNWHLQNNNLGLYVDSNGMPVRSNPGPISPVGANTQGVPNQASAIPAGTYDINATNAQLREDLSIYEPLNGAELQAEGLNKVNANGGQLRVVRAVPDVARQIVEANFGSIIGPSRVVQGTVLVLASVYDHPQNPALTNTLRLNRAPEVPKGASYPHPGGVFSRVAFSSLFPSVSNQASFQEFGVVVDQ